MKRTMRILSPMVVLGLLVGGAVVCRSGPVEAAGVAVSVNAPAEVVKGDSFALSIDITDVTAFDAGQFDVSFDESLLQLDSVTAGQIGATQIPVDLWNEMSAGTYRIIVNVPGVPGVSGSGSLAVLQFHAASSAVGGSALTFSNGFLNSNLASEIAATWTGDSISVRDRLGITAPRVTTNAPTSLSTTSVTLNAHLASMGTADNVTVYFEWGLTASYGNMTTSRERTAIGAFSDTLAGLAAGTEYHFRAVAAGDDLAVYGDDMAFSTSGLADTTAAHSGGVSGWAWVAIGLAVAVVLTSAFVLIRKWLARL